MESTYTCVYSVLKEQNSDSSIILAVVIITITLFFNFLLLPFPLVFAFFSLHYHFDDGKYDTEIRKYNGTTRIMETSKI